MPLKPAMSQASVLAQLQRLFPQLHFVSGPRFCWSPELQEVRYRRIPANCQHAVWSLLHETGHALLGHRNFTSDLELLRMERQAWQQARKLAADLSITIDEEHIEDCLDSYRDWLYQRSICPNCGSKCLQQGDLVYYRCFNCHASWRVTGNRFSRAYRRQAAPLPVFQSRLT